MDPAIRTMLEAAILAPSGENSQPWRFRIDNKKIELWNDPASDQSLYNFEQRGSYIAHGAALENITIAAHTLGLEPKIGLFPDASKPDLVALVELDPTAPAEETLFPIISRRATNRKPYEAKPLSDEEIRMLQSVTTTSEILKLVTDESVKKTVAQAVSVNDKLVLQNKNIHDFFFSHVRWNEAESKEHPDGFYVPTLELLPPQLMGFKLFRRWGLVNMLNKLIGAANFVASENAKVFMQSAAMGAILIPQATPEHFVRAGRVVERIWLHATEMGLSFQPLVGGSFLTFNILAGKPKGFTEAEIGMLKEAHEKLKQVFGIREETIAMIFRIGKDGAPSARSPRFALEHFIKNG